MNREKQASDGLDEIRAALDEVMRERYTGTKQSYQLWFGRLRLELLDAERAVFACETKMKCGIVSERYSDLIADSLEEVLGYRPEIAVTVDPALRTILTADGAVLPKPRTGGQNADPAADPDPSAPFTLPRNRDSLRIPGQLPDPLSRQYDERDDDGEDDGDEGWQTGMGDIDAIRSTAEGNGTERQEDGGQGWPDEDGEREPDYVNIGAPSVYRIVGHTGAPAANSGASRPSVPGSASRPVYKNPAGGDGGKEDLASSDDGRQTASRENAGFSGGIPTPSRTVPPSSPDLQNRLLNGPGRDYTFETFIVGRSNQMAHAAALSVADNVGMSINPLFIWGPSGLGKTHLMYAIANRAMKRDPGLKIVYVKGEEFMNQMIEAIRRDRNQAFRDKYRKADMLLIDDIQFIAGKESTQTEFFHTFDALYEDRKQIVITSDRPPKELTSLESRIRSRFEAGLLVDIQPPDYELRMAILKEKISQNHVEVPTDVIDFLATNLQENIRQLEGVVKKLAMKHMISGDPVTMEMVLKTVPEYIRSTEPLTDTVARIIAKVAAHYSVTPDDILGKDRKKNIQTARNVSMYLVRTVTGASYPQIGVFFYRDHSTVHSNIAKVEAELASDAVFEARVAQISKEIQRG